MAHGLAGQAKRQRMNKGDIAKPVLDRLQENEKQGMEGQCSYEIAEAGTH